LQSVASSSVNSTFPRMLLQHARERSNAPAMREKNLGIWQTFTWGETLERVKALAGGLAALGFKRGDNLAIIGENRPQLYWAMMAAQALGGVPVPFYQDGIASEMKIVLEEAGIQFAVVEDQEQVDKLLEILPELPAIKHIVFDDPRGLRNYTQPQLVNLDKLCELGREYAKSHPDFFAKSVEAGRADDVAVMLYTSGTTGAPKGVCQTHAALIATAEVLREFDNLNADDNVLCYLPMAWVGDFLYSFALTHVAGFCLNCPESPETVLTDMKEIGPSFYFAPPRVYENILTQVMIRIEDASTIKRKLFHYFMGVAKRVGMRTLDAKSTGVNNVSLIDRMLYKLGEILIYGPLKNVLGMSRVRVAYTGGEAIGPDLFDFYRSLGINLKQLYGMTETCVTVAMQRSGEVKLDTVGKPMPGVTVKIAASGEVLVLSPGMMKEYYKKPADTAEVIDENGYFRTGDAGFFDPDGHLKIIDRAKDVGRLKDGTLFAPKYLENKLKFFPHVKEAVAFGDKSDNATAMINIDMAAVGDWAERRNLGYAGYADLAAKADVYELIRDCVAKVNFDLASDPNLCGSQIKRFVILHKELDADDGELTRTRKVRRRVIGEKYAKIIDALYSNDEFVSIEAQMKFEDGRVGIVKANLKIEDVKMFTPAEAALSAKKAA
jgi:long-chain acyl-CoA synthetase